MSKTTNNGKKGGILQGKSHKQGGIKAIVTDTNEMVELEGGEAIINKEATKLHKKELSRINQSAGNGVPILEKGGEIKSKKMNKRNFTKKKTNKEKYMELESKKIQLQELYMDLFDGDHSNPDAIKMNKEIDELDNQMRGINYEKGGVVDLNKTFSGKKGKPITGNISVIRSVIKKAVESEYDNTTEESKGFRVDMNNGYYDLILTFYYIDFNNPRIDGNVIQIGRYSDDTFYEYKHKAYNSKGVKVSLNFTDKIVKVLKELGYSVNSIEEGGEFSAYEKGGVIDNNKYSVKNTSDYIWLIDGEEQEYRGFGIFDNEKGQFTNLNTTKDMYPYVLSSESVAKEIASLQNSGKIKSEDIYLVPHLRHKFDKKLENGGKISDGFTEKGNIIELP